ncbi:MAG: BatA domain-containing protein [Planctomycetes bacterium]|nr:BatA domain-containing protein [Planctomycetota bacterium]
MNLLAAPALILLAAAAVLVALATMRRGPKRRDVGTLLIWQRIAEQAQAQKRSRRNFDWLLWLLLGALIAGGIGAARPAWLKPSAQPRVAVFIERLQPGADEPGLEDAIERARKLAPDSELTFYLAGADELEEAGELKSLRPGAIQAELAQFAARSRDADGRVLLLCAPVNGATDLGVVVSRVNTASEGAVFEIRPEGDRVIVRETTPDRVQIFDARILSSRKDGRVRTWECKPVVDDVEVQLIGSDERIFKLKRRPFVIGVGEDWQGDAHGALYEALGADSADGGEPSAWLGNRDRTPAVRINLGARTDLSGAQLSYDPGHLLFHELPIESFDWLGEGRLLAPDESARPLVSAMRDGERLGDLVRLKAGGVLEFAGDPFTHAPVAAAALLLDNALGVVTGERPSERARYEPVGDWRLPSERAALAEPFEPQGELDLSTRNESEPLEFTTWLTLAAALLVLAATALLLRRE